MRVVRGFISREVWKRHPHVVSVDAHGITLGEGPGRLHVSHSEMSAYPTVRKGWIWSTLRVASQERGIIAVPGIGHDIGSQLQQRAAELFLSATHERFSLNLPALASAVKRLRDLTSCYQFVRTSERLTLENQVRTALSICSDPLWPRYAQSELRDLADELKAFVTGGKETIAACNERFEEAALARWRTLFDRVERLPLTTQQRLACVRNEDRNLVVATAGSGKTSTMVGRAAYLVQARLAEPEGVLLLAFNSSAASELRKRMEPIFEIDQSPIARTFHAIGLEIIGKVERRKPALSKLSQDEAAKREFLARAFDRLAESPAYKSDCVQFGLYHQTELRLPFDFKEIRQYRDFVRRSELRTLNGELVKSFEELQIANFLAQHSVRYSYEKPYEIDVATPERRQYRPDFYLIDYGVYLEHFGLDKLGKPANWVNRQDYLRGIDWKRETHRLNKTVLLETFSWQHSEGVIFDYLRHKLVSLGIELVPRDDSQLLAELSSRFGPIGASELAGRFISLMKASQVTWEALVAKARSTVRLARLVLLVRILKPLFEAYEANLAWESSIDFEDMIIRAAKYVEEGLYCSPYTHILIDEFQDISAGRARLVQALLGQRPDATLFAVGDDWQGIYRFAGSDGKFIFEFEQRFGPTAETVLETTFRFGAELGEISGSFVLQNSQQKRKLTRSARRRRKPCIMRVPVGEPADGLRLALQEIRAESPEASVLVLGREWRHLADAEAPQGGAGGWVEVQGLRVQARTVHSAKGLEADFVVVVGVEKGAGGFPSERPAEPLLELLLPDSDSYPFAEERRLFYVALTRAKEAAFLVYRSDRRSEFVKELERLNSSHIGRIQNDLGGIVVDLPWVACPRCESGNLLPREGPWGPFVGCDSFPFCEYKEAPCPLCGGLMVSQGLVRSCATPECSGRGKLCPRCRAPLVKRAGPRGQFLGCSKFRGNEPDSCRYTEALAETIGDPLPF